MLSLVENARRKQMAWVEAILDHRKWRASRLAKEAGIDQSTISKFLNDPLNAAQLNTLSVEKIARVGGIPPYQSAPINPPRGLAETEATLYEGDPASGLQFALEALKAGKNGINTWLLHSRALENAGYVPGDILVVDLNASPAPGDAVYAEVFDRVGRPEAVMRLYEDPFLVAASLDRDFMRPLLVDNDRVVVRGVVIASVRPRRAA